MDRPVGYTVGCAQRNVTPALANGAFLTVLQSMQGFSPQALPMQFGLNTCFVYAYALLQCPLEAIHGRQSLLHNVFAGEACNSTAWHTDP